MHSAFKNILLFSFILLTLNGCGNESSMATVIKEPLSLLTAQPKPIDLNRAKKLPYASMAIQLGDNPKAMLVLAYAVNQERQWVSADKKMLVTRKGILVRTFGLANNMQSLVYQTGFNPFKQNLANIKKQVTAKGTISISPGDFSTIPFRASFHVEGTETVAILDSKRRLKKIKQVLRVPELHWTAINYFWVDAKTGFIWQSVQHFSPKEPQLWLQQLKPFTADIS